MTALKRIAVDAMGGEGGVETTVPASLQALQNNPDLRITLVGDEQRLQPCLHSAPVEVRRRLSVLHSSQAISDLDNPTNILRSGRESSLFIATELVNEGEVQAMVSAGNTGAMLMAGRHVLKTIAGIQKPAIVATIPGARQQCYLLDVGANPQCSAQQLFEFAVMGSVLAESLGSTKATVGLLNIGEEQYKGTAEVRTAADMLEACEELNYIGFVEANALFAGAADVVVCDGFVGNVTIKSSAGVANVINDLLAAQVEKSLLTRLSGFSSTSILSRLTGQINPQRFNGASLLGLQGSIVKSHGNATVEGFYYAIQHAVREIENSVPQLIADRVAAIMAANN